ncbi:MAG: T9SS type A sorting domain-containing protein [Bacteroidia bacterium]
MNDIAGGVPQNVKNHFPPTGIFTYLEAIVDQEEVRIDWGLTDGETPDYFIVERQVGLQPFEVIGGVNYHASRPARMFSFVDMNPVRNTTVTYRIKEVREDDSVIYSDKITIYIPENREYYTYPSAVTDIINLEYALPFLTGYEIRLFDYTGSMLFNKINKQPVDLRIKDKIIVSDLPAGLYFLQVIVGGEVHTRRVIKI